MLGFAIAQPNLAAIKIIDKNFYVWNINCICQSAERRKRESCENQERARRCKRGQKLQHATNRNLNRSGRRSFLDDP